MILIGVNDLLTKKLKKIPLKLEDSFWHYISWYPHKSIMLSNRGLIKNYIRYNIVRNLNARELKGLKESYTKNSVYLELDIKAPRFSK